MPVFTGVLEISVQGTVATTGSGTKNIFNIFHFKSDTFPLPDSKVAVADAFIAQTWLDVFPCLSSQYTGVQTLVRVLDDATDQYVNATTPNSGAIAGARLPTNVAVSYLFRSANRGKSFRGAKRFGVIAESDVVGDELTAASLTAHWNALTGALSNPLVGGGLVGTYRPIVLSRMLSQLSVNPTTIVGSLVTSALLNRTIGSMRRRKEKTVR